MMGWGRDDSSGPIGRCSSSDPDKPGKHDGHRPGVCEQRLLGRILFGRASSRWASSRQVS